MRKWVVYAEIANELRGELAVARARIATLEAREWSRYEEGERPLVAMPDPGPDPDAGYEYHYDPTGLVRDRVEIPSGE